jgi:hypothetical protein
MSLELATAAITLLAPYLKDAGTEAAKKLGKESAGAAIDLLGWLREKLTGHARQTLAELEEKPDSQLNQQAMSIELAKLLEREPNLVVDLQKFLSSAPGSEGHMIQTVGAGAAAAQAKGNQNTITINTGSRGV